MLRAGRVRGGGIEDEGGHGCAYRLAYFSEVGKIVTPQRRPRLLAVHHPEPASDTGVPRGEGVEAEGQVAAVEEGRFRGGDSADEEAEVPEVGAAGEEVGGSLGAASSARSASC